MNNSIEDLLALRRLQVSPQSKKSLKIISVHWVFPILGWLKVNIDVAVLNEKGGSGGIF